MNKKFNFSLELLLTEKSKRYLEDAAHARGMSKTRLLRDIVVMVIDEQLVLSVLDDGKTAPVNEVAPEHYHVPSVFKSKSKSYTFRKHSKSLTKEQLSRELQRAVLNTGGVLV